MNKYNGYTNYATWRIQLEMIDGQTPEDFGTYDQAELAGALQEYVQTYLEANAEGITLGYALAFAADVSWWELAELMLETYPKEEAA